MCFWNPPFLRKPGLCRYGEEGGEIEYGNGPENQCQKSSEDSSKKKKIPKGKAGDAIHLRILYQPCAEMYSFT